MKLRTLYAVACLALAMSAASCSTISKIAGYTVDQRSISVAVYAFDGAKATATNALNLPICTDAQTEWKDGCITKATGKIIVKDVRAGTAARDALWTASKADPDGVGIKAAYQAVVAATSALEADLK